MEERMPTFVEGTREEEMVRRRGKGSKKLISISSAPNNLDGDTGL